VRLADGSDESRRRTDDALADLARYLPELFAADAVDAAAETSRLGPRAARCARPGRPRSTRSSAEAG
jgi:ring-1,2-phenylacetyl-CoA epoxidase subunit PaaC